MIISGKELSAQLKAEMAGQVATFLEKYGRVPHLTVILVGKDHPVSQSYVKGNGKACETVGIRNTTILLPGKYDRVLSGHESFCTIGTPALPSVSS